MRMKREDSGISAVCAGAPELPVPGNDKLGKPEGRRSNNFHTEHKAIRKEFGEKRSVRMKPRWPPIRRRWEMCS